MADKDVSNAELARMIAEGFSSQGEEMRKGFAEVGERLDGMDKHFVVIEDHLEKIDLQLEQIKPAQERITALEIHVASMQEQLDKMQMQVA